MRVLVAGATGAVGTHLVPQLLEHGHTVVGTSRSKEGAARLGRHGAEGVVLDLLDARAVHDAVLDGRARRDRAPGHRAQGPVRLQALRSTASPPRTACARPAPTTCSPRRRSHGVGRVVAQSFAGWPSGRGGSARDDGGRPARPGARAGDAPVARRHPPPGGGRGRGGRRGAALRRPLRRPGRRADRHRAQAPLPDRRRRRRRVVVRPPRRRGGGHRAGAGSGVAGRLQRRRRRPGARARVAAGAGRGAGREAAAPRAALAGPAGGGRGRRGDDDRGAGRANARAKRELGWTLRYPTWRQGFPAAYRAVARAAA